MAVMPPYMFVAVQGEDAAGALVGVGDGVAGGQGEVGEHVLLPP